MMPKTGYFWSLALIGVVAAVAVGCSKTGAKPNFDAGTDGDVDIDAGPQESCDEEDPCGEHGTCDDYGGVIDCDCDDGWGGEFCDECADGFNDADGGCLLDEQCLRPISNSFVRTLSQLFAARAIETPTWNRRTLDRVKQRRQTILLAEDGVHRRVLELRCLGLPAIKQQLCNARIIDRRQSFDSGKLQIQRLSCLH